MKRKILLIDDNLDLAYIVKSGLEKIDNTYEVMSVNSGRECFEFLNKGSKPDLIILDIMMPQMNGWEVFAKLKEKEIWRDIPIVFLTAKTDSYSKGFGKIPSDDYIEKPFKMDELKQRLDNVLKRKYG